MKYYSKLMIVFTLLSVIVFAGCATMYTHKPYYFSPYKQTASNKYYDASISPVELSRSGEGWKAFQLIIKNKTEGDIEVDWNRTLFINQGSTYGTFMTEGVVYKDRNNPRSSDVIFSGSTFTRTIWPSNLVDFSGSWYHEGMGYGNYGVLLSIKINGKELREKLTITFTNQRENIVNKSTGEESEIKLTEDWIGFTVDEALIIVSINHNQLKHSNFQVGDFILEINRIPIGSISIYREVIQQYRGSNLLFLISRNNNRIFVTLK